MSRARRNKRQRTKAKNRALVRMGYTQREARATSVLQWVDITLRDAFDPVVKDHVYARSWLTRALDL